MYTTSTASWTSKNIIASAYQIAVGPSIQGGPSPFLYVIDPVDIYWPYGRYFSRVDISDVDAPITFKIDNTVFSTQ